MKQVEVTADWLMITLTMLASSWRLFVLFKFVKTYLIIQLYITFFYFCVLLACFACSLSMSRCISKTFLFKSIEHLQQKLQFRSYSTRDFPVTLPKHVPHADLTNLIPVVWHDLLTTVCSRPGHAWFTMECYWHLLTIFTLISAGGKDQALCAWSEACGADWKGLPKPTSCTRLDLFDDFHIFHV